ncbi:MAG TPA: IS21-like element helper ATPase IstB [Bacteroidales bacterium]|nr:ATP-binding protein [Bacteroidales bacterium]HQG36215.1 IS21-like element helper ATPase IstB [Bacteroidales bacterium]HQG53533.1 IS21-like element helper ATPase IstB [Bacteroidales bacterium]HRC88874.1 IS21-like element helper ATPase IstB [Bacteroidales bacterium]
MRHFIVWLHGMARAYEAALSVPLHEQVSFDMLVPQMAEAELQERVNRKTQLCLRQSKLRYNAILEQVYCSAARNITSEQLIRLADEVFIQRAENILITGATGSGKSYLACALGRQACSLGYRVIYFGMNRFLEKVSQSKLDGTFITLLNQIEKTHLLILDEFGLTPLDNITRLAILQILEDRYGKKSTIITSQLPISKWYEFICGPRVLGADVIMDRLPGNAHRIELKGESLRIIKKEKTRKK